jgi:hypothetical protein
MIAGPWVMVALRDPFTKLILRSDPAVLSSPPYFAPHTDYQHIKSTDMP